MPKRKVNVDFPRLNTPQDYPGVRMMRDDGGPRWGMTLIEPTEKLKTWYDDAPFLMEFWEERRLSLVLRFTIPELLEMMETLQNNKAHFEELAAIHAAQTKQP